MKRFLSINLAEVREKRFLLFELEIRVFNRLRRAIDASKNVSAPAKNDLGISRLKWNSSCMPFIRDIRSRRNIRRSAKRGSVFHITLESTATRYEGDFFVRRFMVDKAKAR
jgi:hypothetical protein